MSDSESLDYLQAGFDPSSLTVPRLRSILVTYNVNYPATAKKPQLIELFNENVVPQSKKILRERARAKRSSMGIVDAAAPTSSQDLRYMDEDLMPPPAPPVRRGSPRKSRVKQESVEPELEPELRSPRKRQQRAGSRQATTASDTDTTDADAAPRNTRRSRTKTPQPQPPVALKPKPIKLEPPLEEGIVFKNDPSDDSVFTDDNPFQSGSSPPPVKTPSNRRKTTGMEVTKSSMSSAVRRRTDGPLVAPKSDRNFSRSFEIPARQLGLMTPEPSGLEPGEEFTPDEQLELAQDDALRQERDRALVRRPAKRSRNVLTAPFWILMLALLGAYAGWFRQEKIAVGYCGLGREAGSIIPQNMDWPGRLRDIELPSWLRNVEIPEVPQFLRDIKTPAWVRSMSEPQCEPCPPHATCYSDFSVKCDNDYILKPHPLSVGGIIPLPPTCEPDGEKARRVKVVADRAVEELRDRRAKWECGDLVEEDGTKPETPAMEEQVLKEIISEKRSKRLNKEEFDDLWAAALGEIKSRDEIEVETEEVEQYVLPNFPLFS
jgi:hypothetical protein